MYSPVLDNTSVVDSSLKDTHMSIEQAISDNTAAIYELISTLTNQARQVTLDLKAPKYDALPANPVVTLVPPAGTVTLTGFSPLLDSLPEPPAELIPDPMFVPTYDDVSAAIKAVFRTNRELVVSVLAKYGAKKGPELKPADYAAFLADLA
jgi:hypothetical protein